jgi:DNA replication and repair protein RecF
MGEKAQRTLYQYFSIIYPRKSHCKKQTPQYQQALKMYLKDFIIQLQEFFRANFEFDGKIICFVKTVSEKRMYLMLSSYGKSYFNPLAVQNIKHGEEFFVIDAEFIKKMRNEQVVCSLKKGQKSIKAQWQSLRQIFRPCRFYSLGNHFACRSGFDCRRQ